MLSYHSDAAVKAKYLARVTAHADADEIVKGNYWQAGKGCAVGCTIHGDTHEDYERELGVPQMLAWLEDLIFEGLPNKLAKTWPERFLVAISPGRDLSLVGWRFLHWLLTESGLSEYDHALVKGVVTQCADTLRPLMDGRPADVTAAMDAAAVAWGLVARAERMPALPDDVAWSAESAARAAESAALSATSSAASAEHAMTAASAAIAGSRGYTAMSEKLLSLLESA